MITAALALAGLDMIGVEPSDVMLDVARRRPGADAVDRICGSGGQLGERDADLAFMSGHVAQFFITDAEWLGALCAVHAALRPGGWVSFETRDPNDRAWEGWTSVNKVVVGDPVAGRIETWSELLDLDGGVASYANHYVFCDSDDHLVSPARLRFRSLDELTHSLLAAGFAVQQLYGDRNREPVGPMTSEFIVVAQRP